MRYKEVLSEISSSLTLTATELIQLATKSPYTYKVYEINKKTGGLRTIAQPARETKFLQRELILRLFSDLPIHGSATAYCSGSSIKRNASAHSGNAFLSKFDFRDFFESITVGDLEMHLRRHLSQADFSDGFIRFASRASCYHNGIRGLTLSVGAPSSPLLSNSIMYEFDCLVSDWCHEKGLVYTRYADDLAFSSNIKGLSFEIEAFLEKTLGRLAYPSLDLNKKKTLHVSRRCKRRVTGLIINNEGRISLGRERKRLISAMIHRFTVGQLAEVELGRLQGLLGFAENVEPLFCASMKSKYGLQVMEKIFQFRVKG
ncbi:retron St85 family RNA-directed DNA polymerase [Pseudomonas solani]|uniref:retron St85 family RNA-directed DNA polymerase n=1 Tax=Pseudomonas solani TaxID=2731552 RepID=UPI003C2CCE17